MLKILIRALLALAIMVLACGVIYPAAVTLASQELFPRQAAGSLVYKDGAPVGSALIAQNWTQTRYFQGRPSANPGGANNAMTSGASNAGPTSLQLVEEVEERVADLKEANPDAEGAVPQDLVTASASGLDPHISPEAALWQAPRVARASGGAARPRLHGKARDGPSRRAAGERAATQPGARSAASGEGGGACEEGAEEAEAAEGKAPPMTGRGREAAGRGPSRGRAEWAAKKSQRIR